MYVYEYVISFSVIQHFNII